MKLFPRLLIAISCVVLPLSGFPQGRVLLRTFNDPTPAAGEGFGACIAPLGSDRVLITGVPGTNGPAVYLFSTNGALLTTFTNWAPAAITAVGTDRVLIGDYTTNAYLLNTNGALVTTITNFDLNWHPLFQGDEWFGSVVAAFGTDRMLIAAPNYWAYWVDPYFGGQGRAYLFSTNGTPLTTFDNPNPQEINGFGSLMAAFGSDRVLIGSPGRPYLFSTNGTVLMTFTNPAPAFEDYFGSSVAAVGADRVLIGAPGDDAAGTNAGVAYLFSTNGTLLTTITNPTPAAGDNFGVGLARLGNDRLIISAPGDDTGAADAGSAYVFGVNGALLATITNPTPATGDRFGSQVAALGGEVALIATPLKSTMQLTNAGAVYLFGIPSVPDAPLLTIHRTTTNTVAVSWPSPSSGFMLQQNTHGLSSVNWSNVSATIQDDGTSKSLIVDPTNTNRFYRLVRP